MLLANFGTLKWPQSLPLENQQNSNSELQHQDHPYDHPYDQQGNSSVIIAVPALQQDDHGWIHSPGGATSP